MDFPFHIFRIPSGAVLVMKDHRRDTDQRNSDDCHANHNGVLIHLITRIEARPCRSAGSDGENPPPIELVSLAPLSRLFRRSTLKVSVLSARTGSTHSLWNDHRPLKPVASRS